MYLRGGYRISEWDRLGNYVLKRHAIKHTRTTFSSLFMKFRERGGGPRGQDPPLQGKKWTHIALPLVNQIKGNVKIPKKV